MRRIRKTRPKSHDTEEAEVIIDRLGRQGDGIAQHCNHSVYVPLSVPGDRLQVRLSGETGRISKIVEAGPDRIDPACAHFGKCGGCRLQHLAQNSYLGWKCELVCDALLRANIEAAIVADPIAIPPRTRRRVTLAARRTSTDLVLGFNERQSGRIVRINDCVIARSEIVSMLPPLRDLLFDLLAPSETVDAVVTVLNDGVDLVLVGGEPPDLRSRQMMAEFAEVHDLARLSWRRTMRDFPEPVAHRRAGTFSIGSGDVVLPPGGFCQASGEGEVALSELVMDAVGRSQAIADLFCGIGTFGLRLAAAGKRVVARDGDAAAIEAFDRATRRSGFAQRTNVAVRDLFRDPLSANELNDFDAVVFDPPRAGAKAQAAEIAASSVPLVVAVSCNPTTFARDARLLIDGGYRLDRVTPVDQFVWSNHVELVAVFRR
ncbi:MAG: methyltransferase [Pseudomonadota bacterium]